jgi:hypothetical protein
VRLPPAFQVAGYAAINCPSIVVFLLITRIFRLTAYQFLLHHPSYPVPSLLATRSSKFPGTAVSRVLHSFLRASSIINSSNIDTIPSSTGSSLDFNDCPHHSAEYLPPSQGPSHRFTSKRLAESGDPSVTPIWRRNLQRHFYRHTSSLATLPAALRAKKSLQRLESVGPIRIRFSYWRNMTSGASNLSLDTEDTSWGNVVKQSTRNDVQLDTWRRAPAPKKARSIKLPKHVRSLGRGSTEMDVPSQRQHDRDMASLTRMFAGCHVGSTPAFVSPGSALTNDKHLLIRVCLLRALPHCQSRSSFSSGNF